MTCEECKDLLAQYALDVLDEIEGEQVRIHLEGGSCDCADHLAMVQSVVDVLPLSLAPVTPPAGSRSLLMKRISDPPLTPVREKVGAAAARPSRFSRFAEALLAGGVAAMIAIGVFWYLFAQQRRSVASLREELNHAQSEIRLLRSSVSQTNQSIQLLQSPGVQLVSLDGTPAQPRAKARVFWDQARGEWHFYASNLKPLADGRTYELWLIDSDQRKIPAGTFAAEKNGEAMAVARSKPDLNRVVALAVTDEPGGGVPQPTGQIQLLGQIK